MSNEQAKGTYLFEVLASTKAESGNHVYYANLTVHVVTTSVEEAIALFRTEHPDARLHKVERRNYLGNRGVMIDPKILP